MDLDKQTHFSLSEVNLFNNHSIRHGDSMIQDQLNQ